jgi:hypothetical protein
MFMVVTARVIYGIDHRLGYFQAISVAMYPKDQG